MARQQTLKPEEINARAYADRLILEKLTELYEVVKPSEIADQLQGSGIGLGAVRSLLSSNSDRFAFAERRWIPAARLEGLGRPFAEALCVLIDRFGGPMPLQIAVGELSRLQDRTPEWVEVAIRRLAKSDSRIFVTSSDLIGLSAFAFVASDEAKDRAFALNGVSDSDLKEIQEKLGAKFDWLSQDALISALEKTAPVNAKALGAVAWLAISEQGFSGLSGYDWKAFYSELYSVPSFVFSADGCLHPESETSGWAALISKVSDKLVVSVEFEDATPLELKKEDVEKSVENILRTAGTTTALSILESQFEITPTVKTFPDDFKNLMSALKSDSRVAWVGGDRFRKPNEAPDFVHDIPEPFQFKTSDHIQDDGDPVDAELTEDGLSSSLRKLILHPLATDVLDEEPVAASKNLPDTLRLVLKPIHRELGTFPLSQFPTGFFESEPQIQELIFVNPQGQELQVWMNQKSRLLFNLFDWWLDQPVESGAVFSLAKTNRANVLEFSWLDQTDPIVYISSQRMEELRELASRSEDMSSYDLTREVIAHWSKGVDFLTLLWEVNVVRRTSRNLLASLLSSYNCFFQRSGSPVWHYDHRKVEAGFDKAKKKFIKKD